MGNRVIITEQQTKDMVEILLIESILGESFFELSSLHELKVKLLKALGKGVIITGTVIASIAAINNLTPEQTKELQVFVGEHKPQTEVKQDDWKLRVGDVIATVYNAVPEQCNDDIQHTASMFRLNLNNPEQHRIIAMERTFMKSLGLKYGDVVKIVGTGKNDGVWQVQDLMNKRFKGMHKIDLLVSNDVKYGQWDGVKLYTLKDGVDNHKYTSELSPQSPKSTTKNKQNKS